MRVYAVPGASSIALALVLAATPLYMAVAGEADAPPSDSAVQPLDEATAAALGQALLFDPASVTQDKPTKPLRLPSLSPPSGLNVSGAEKADGSSTVAVKQPLPTDWDTKVGVDLSLAAPPPLTYQPDRPMPGTQGDATSGAAWASMGVPNLASIDARVDRGNDQGRLGGTLQHSVPIGSDLSVTLRNSYAVSDALNSADATASAPAGLPIMTLPQQTASAAPEPVWSNERGVKFNILPTGTTLAAGLTSASNDPVTHNTLSADQKLYGNLHVTTSVSDIGTATPNKTISAGFKLNW